MPTEYESEKSITVKSTTKNKRRSEAKKNRNEEIKEDEAEGQTTPGRKKERTVHKVRLEVPNL